MCKAYVTFKKLRRKKDRKTDIWIVNKINSNIEIVEKLGIIKFDGAWRQFICETANNTKWSASCFDQISDFLKEQNNKWRNKIKYCNDCKNSAEFNHCYFNSDCKTKDEFCKRYCRKKW